MMNIGLRDEQLAFEGWMFEGYDNRVIELYSVDNVDA